MVQQTNSNEGHPDEGTLDDFVMGRLEAEKLEQVAEHIAGCEFCLTRIQSLANKQDTLLDKLKETDFRYGTLGEQTPTVEEFDSICRSIESSTRYRMIRQIGTGGMGAVYLAEHEVMHRQVAIKVIRKEFVANQEAIQRFKNEVRNAARLSHRNIVTAFDADQASHLHFLVMEFVPGKSLAQVIEESGPLPVSKACDFVLQVAQGLEHALEQQMSHRDIKPANLMCTPRGVIKILDFGLARVADDHDVTLTSTGALMGTIDYIAPEQARDAKSADIRSDLYSLGCTFYFLITGQPPFPETNRVDKIIAHCSKPFPDVRNRQKDVPIGVAQIIAKLTEKDADKRYQTPAELINDLEPFANSGLEVDDEIRLGLIQTPNAQSETNETEFDTGTVTGTIVPLSPSNQNVLARFKFLLKRHPIRFAAAGLILTLLLFAVYLTAQGVFFMARNGDDPSPKPKALLVMSSKRFWFSDYEPISRVLGENDIDLIVSSDRTGEARYFRNELDDAPNKYDVEIKKSVEQLVAAKVYEDIDAVIFIGTDTHEFRGDDPTGNSVRKLLSEMNRQGKWITSVGKGSEVPMFYGIYDGIDVCQSEHQDPEVVRQTKARLVDRNVLQIDDAKVLTAAMWDDAEAFAKTLSKILTTEKANKQVE